MSHFKERKEKNCLNCNAEVQGKYCHICGQENIEPKETFWSLLTHFVYDVMHFDGKFFSTLQYLLTKPGYLSQEYLRGRRASYLHPIKMYVFTSAIFFIIFFSFVVNPAELSESIQEDATSTLTTQMDQAGDSLKYAIANEPDSAERQRMTELLNSMKIFSKEAKAAVATNADEKDSTADSGKVQIKESDSIHFRFMGNDDLPATVEQYDSLQHILPEKDRDDWFTNVATHKAIVINNRYSKDSHKFWEDFLEKFLHSIPQVMFITLPLVALIMQLLYLRKRKEVFYVNHVIFLTHVYIALFICFLLKFAVSGLYKLSDFILFKWLGYLIGTYIFIYCCWAMKRFYGQGIMKTVFKYCILLLLALLLFSFVFIVFAVKSFL